MWISNHLKCHNKQIDKVVWKWSLKMVTDCQLLRTFTKHISLSWSKIDVPILLQVLYTLPCVLFMCNNSLLLSADLLSQLQLHPLHGDAAQQGVLLREQPDEGSDRADAAQLRDAAGSHLHAAARPLRPAAQGVAGQFAVSPSCSLFFFF